MPTEPRNTYLFRWGQSFVPRCPIDDGVHRLKKIYFFPPVQFVRNGSPCEWKTTFSTFFFLFFCSSYQLNELFFIRRQRYAISPTTMPFFVASLTSILSLERTFSFFSFFYFSFSLLSFPLYSLIPRPLVSLVRHVSSEVGQPRPFVFIFCVPGPFSLLSSLHLHLLTVVRFLVFPRSFLFLNSYRRFSPSQFYHFFLLLPSSTLTRSLPFSHLYPSHEFFSPRFYEFSDHFFPPLSLFSLSNI